MSIECAISLGTSPSNLVANPIQPAWILDGKPLARLELLSSSADGTASTYIWDCTAGRFNWFYGFDETFHILEGTVTLKYPSGACHRVAAGDTVFFPKGSSAEWTVDKYVRKLAFCRTPVPGYLTFARQVVRTLKRAVRGNSAKDGGSGLL
ncbi:MAG TPA: cupin domain-containing protein [Steroidobacteraceae bacterium]|nr:cupin domain-containing protein [Steroidobacteraceae bacterium]